MPNRAADWLRQAEHDLAQAQDSRESGRHDWACFAAHQAAEKALKALHLSQGQEAWGHVVARLIESLPPGGPDASGFLDRARVLDNFYIPTRYPNGHPAGPAFEHFGTVQSEQGIEYAGQIIEFVRSHVA